MLQSKPFVLAAIVVALASSSTDIIAQTPIFEEAIGTIFPEMYNGATAFCDVDGDGDLDVLLTGEDQNSTTYTKLYMNNGSGVFTENTLSIFVPVYRGGISFGDIDGDADKDVFIHGTSINGPSCKLYDNDGFGNYSENTNTILPQLAAAAASFADVDNDGDQDLLYTGVIFQTYYMLLLLNDGAGTFSQDPGMTVPGVHSGSVTFADVDDDQDEDLFITGSDGTNLSAKLYMNDGGGTFTEQPGSSFFGIFHSSVEFADVNNDSYIDILASGYYQTGASTELYLNSDTTTFTKDEVVQLPDVYYGDIDIADVDGNDTPDIMIMGNVLSSGVITKVFSNDGSGGFTEMIGLPFVPVSTGSISSADVDGDTDQDILVTGYSSSGPITKLYLNCNFGSIFYADTDSDGFGDPLLDTLACSQPVGFVANNTDCDDNDDLTYPGAPCDDGLDYTYNDSLDEQCNCAGDLGTVVLKVFLEGPYDPNNGLMHDSLRVQGLIPLTEPYTALGYAFDQNGASGTVIAASGSTIDPSVLTVTGPDAIVDWVVVELREKDDPRETLFGILKSRVALIQRDGDVVDLDGISAIAFSIDPEDYYVAVEHRNHLPAMTSSAVEDFGMIGFSANMTMASQTMYNSIPSRNNINGVMVQARGDVLSSDQSMRYSGSGNDRDPILVRIGGSVPTAIVSGYFVEDATMDGRVRYTGPGNDRDPILINIGGSVPTAVRSAPLP